MYYIWFPIYEMYYMYLYMYYWIIFRVLFVWGGVVSIHENREPSDLLGPWAPYCVDFNDLFLFLVGREECSLVSFHDILGVSYDSIPGEVSIKEFLSGHIV